MAKSRSDITFNIRARDKTRAVFRRIRSGFTSLGRSITSIRGLLTGAILGGITKAMLGFGASITAASERLDMSTDHLQSWQRQASEVANVGGAELTNVFQRISRNAGQAVRGNTSMIERFRALGITFKELRNLSPDELMLAVADGVQRLSDAGRRREAMAALADIGDSEAVRLIGLLERGSGAFLRETQRLADAGVLQSAEALRAQAEAQAELQEMAAKAQAEFARVMIEAMPAFTAAVETLAELIRETKDVMEGTPVLNGQVPRATTQQGTNVPMLGFTPPGTMALMQRQLEAQEETARNTREGGALN